MNIELTNSNDKCIPHPVLDDSTKMMRIIANPVYDKLTISRAAHIQNYNSTEYVCKSARINRSKAKSMMTPMKSLSNEQTITTPLSINTTQSQSKSTLKRQNSLPFQLPRPSISSNRNIKTSIPSRSQSIQSSNIIDNNKKPINNGTIRYVNSEHGFEIQRYSSSNWLSIDLLNKDICQTQEKIFREMLDKKEQDELLSRSIYTSEYYRKRWYDLLQSYKQENLTHYQWAKQNYQLNCLKTFYIKAFQREQSRMNLHTEKLRQRRAKSAFNQWKENKNDEYFQQRRSHLNSANSQQITSDLLNPSYNFPNHTANRMSISSIMDNEYEYSPRYQPTDSSKTTTVTSDPLYMLDEQRWSLNAMLKRVVGLAEPLPSPPKIINQRYSSLTNISNDSGFESGL